LDFLDASTGAWVRRYSLVSIPPLRPRPSIPASVQQRNRDIFVVGMLALSIGALVWCYLHDLPTSSPRVLQAIAAAGLYRALDIFITLVRTGVFFSFRGDVRINQEPLWRVQRILVGVMFNYVELVCWFAVAYFQLASTSQCQFNVSITSIHQTLNLSFTTMTTIGYGVYAPNSLLSTILALWQAMTGVTLLAIVVGVVIALMISARQAVEPATNAESASWLTPLVACAGIYAVLYWLSGMTYC
jgi:hypothetical protein